MIKPVPSNRKLPRETPPDVLDLEPAPPASAGSLSPGAPPPRPSRARAVLGAMRTVAGVALVVGVSVAVAWGARGYVKTSPRFAVKDIVVTGSRFRGADQIASEAGIERGKNVFALDLDAAKRRLLDDPWIFEAQLARRLPGTVYVQIIEREAAALVALGDTYLVARDGDIFKRLEPGDPVDLPIVTGISSDAVAEDREGVKQTLRRAIDLAGDYAQSPLASRAALQEIHVAGDGSVSLVVGQSALAIALGEPPFRKKLDQAARVLSELERRGSKADAILLDNETRPERVVVRMR